MSASPPLARLILLAAAIVCAGCTSAPVSLQAVRAFASESARLGGYGELSRRYRDTHAREQAYLPPAAAQLAGDNDAARQATHADFMALHKALVLYMQTLAMLAGETRFDLTPRVDELGAAMQALPDSGLDQRHVAAYTGLIRLLTRALASGYQQRSVASMVREGDAHVRVLLDGMTTLTRLYLKTHRNEQKTVLGVFDIELPFAGRPAERMLATLARAHYQEKAQEYKLLERRYAMALEALDTVARGHAAMMDRLDQLDSEEVRNALAAYARDLRLIREALDD